MARAVWKGTVIADSDRIETVEGHWIDGKSLRPGSPGPNRN